MATLQLIHGSTTVDLDSASGLQWLRGGAQTGKIQLNSLAESRRVTETYQLKLTATSHDNAASTIQSLMKVLKAARNFRQSTWETKPVYLKAQTSNETNPRYAMVYQVDAVTPPGETLGIDFDINNVLTDIRIDLIRENPWRSAVPGTL